VIYKHQVKNADSRPPEDMAKAWAKWFEEVNQLEVIPNHQDKSEYQQILINKYRQQGLDL
jgi:hypothetical protein